MSDARGGTQPRPAVTADGTVRIIHSATTVGIASTDSAVYFAWQDSRNGNAVTNSEDAYFASLRIQGESDGSSSVPGLLVLGSGLLLGMGLAMLAVWLTSSRRPRG